MNFLIFLLHIQFYYDILLYDQDSRKCATGGINVPLAVRNFSP